MEIVRKFGLWIVAGVIVLGAVAFYFAGVRRIAGERGGKVGDLEQRRDKLEEYGKKPQDIPSRKKIAEAKIINKHVAEQLEECKKFLGYQVRDANTRTFFKNKGGELDGVGDPVEGEVAWLELYNAWNSQLQAEIDEAGLGGWRVDRISPWGDGLPKPDEIEAAMELYWFQKDLADLLTGQILRDLERHLQLHSELLRTPADLVIDRSAGREKTDEQRLDNLLRVVKIEKLREVLKAILINREEADLATIFDECLSDDDLPWKRVLAVTMDETQRAYLASLEPKGEGRKDPANLQRFVRVVDELRSVRFRKDVLNLLTNHGFEEYAERLAKNDQEDLLRLTAEIDGEEKRTKLAQAIAAVVSVEDEEDYRLVRESHQPNIIEISDVVIGRPAKGSERRGGERERSPRPERERPGGGARTGKPASSGLPVRARTQTGDRGGARGFYLVWDFRMTVKIEFEQLPVLLRRLLTNNWRYRLWVTRLDPVQLGARPGAARGAGRPSRTRVPAGAAGRSREPRPAGEEAQELVKLVKVQIVGEAHQFLPLLRQIEAQAAKPKAKGGPSSAPEPDKPKRSGNP